MVSVTLRTVYITHSGRTRWYDYSSTVARVPLYIAGTWYVPTENTRTVAETGTAPRIATAGCPSPFAPRKIISQVLSYTRYLVAGNRHYSTVL